MLPSKREMQSPVNRSSAMASTIRCLRLLELLAEEPFELGVSDIARVLDTPRASAHRLCATLVEGGLIESEASTKRYRLTPKALWIGSGYLRHSAIYRAAFFPVQNLARELPGTVQLGVFLENTVLFIYSVGFHGAPDAFADVGLRRPLHATASGKLFLAHMPKADVGKLLSGRLKRYTQHTKVSSVEIERELRSVAVQGYAVNNEELLPGYFVLAAPVLNGAGKCVAAISVTLSAADMQIHDEKSCAIATRTAARRTSIQLGYRPHAEPAEISKGSRDAVRLPVS
jgi:IclR family transcriptional regulator, KDG regulon repressor